jgi:hypothetical protein
MTGSTRLRLDPCTVALHKSISPTCQTSLIIIIIIIIRITHSHRNWELINTITRLLLLVYLMCS